MHCTAKIIQQNNKKIHEHYSGLRPIAHQGDITYRCIPYDIFLIAKCFRIKYLCTNFTEATIDWNIENKLKILETI